MISSSTTGGGKSQMENMPFFNPNGSGFGNIGSTTPNRPSGNPNSGDGWAMPLPILKPPGTGGKSPIAGLNGGTNVTAQSTWKAPDYISEASTQSAVNNRMGQAHMIGDPRVFQKQMARNGLGASKGTGYFSGIGQQQALSQGRADSAGIQAQDQMNNAKARLDYQFGREREAQEMAMAQWGIEQANWAIGHAGRQSQATINAAQQKAVMDMLRRLLS